MIGPKSDATYDLHLPQRPSRDVRNVGEDPVDAEVAELPEFCIGITAMGWPEEL